MRVEADFLDADDGTLLFGIGQGFGRGSAPAFLPIQDMADHSPCQDSGQATDDCPSAAAGQAADERPAGPSHTGPRCCLGVIFDGPLERLAADQ